MIVKIIWLKVKIKVQKIMLWLCGGGQNLEYGAENVVHVRA